MPYRVNATRIRQAAAAEPFCDTSARKIARRTQELAAPGVSKSAVDRALWRGQATTNDALGCFAKTYGLTVDECLVEEASADDEASEVAA